MNLDTVTMNRSEAARLASEYRESVKERQNDEDAQLLRCYEAIAQGQQVINIEAALQTAGTMEQGYPRLAIAHPNAKHVRAALYRDAVVYFWNWDRRIWYAKPKRSGKEQQRVRFDGMRSMQGPYSTLQTIVPNIPPALRPNRFWRTDRILWEVDEWALVAPADPALLRHLGGPLYAVVAVWDLTEVERLVLGHTRQAEDG